MKNKYFVYKKINFNWQVKYISTNQTIMIKFLVSRNQQLFLNYKVTMYNIVVQN